MLTGHLLVATRSLGDPNFRLSVVLIVQHSTEGALGLVLNRPSNTLLKEIWDKISDSPCHTEAALHWGGPCEGPLMAVHAMSSQADLPILEGVFASTDSDKIEELVTHAEEPMRFFLGYAGWGAGQLEKELEEGAWRTAPAAGDLVFGSVDDLWATLNKRLADTLLRETLKVKHVPKDVRMN